MKLAALGVIVAVVGLVVGEAGLLLTAAIWVPGGLLVRAVHGPPNREAKPTTFREGFGGRRGLAVLILVAIGGASVAIGVLPVLFDSEEGWRWIPVAVGGFAAGTQLLALLLFALGSGVGTLVGSHGDPQHPATVRLDSLRETGMRVNDRPRMELNVTVTPEGRPAYAITIKQVIGFAELGALRVGTTYRGLVDLEVPEGVEIDWHAPIGTSAADVAGAAAAEDVTARLARVDQLLRDGVISPEEHASARRDILGEL